MSSSSLPPPRSAPSQLRFRCAGSSNEPSSVTGEPRASINTSPSLLHASRNTRSFNEPDAAEPPRVVWHDADYALYIELFRGEEGEDTDPIAHGIVEAVAVVLRDVGCHVRVFPLQQLDDPIPASSKEDTRAYLITVCSAFLTASPVNGSARKAAAANARGSTALWAQSLPPWITQHAAFKLVSPLSGAARSQQLTRFILKEYRLENDVRLADGTLVFNAHERLIRELLRHEDALRVHVFPLHRDSERDRLILSWKHQFLLRLPLTDVFQYFGPKLAMYFAWLEFYTAMLVVPAIAGVLVSVLGHFSATSYCVLSFAVSIGTSVFVDYWRRRQRAVEYTWKYQLLMDTDAVLDLETRPQFRGEWMIDAVTKQRLYDFPDHKRLARQLLGIPLVVGMCLLVCVYVVALNMLSEHLRGLFPVCYLKHLSYAVLDEHGMSAAACGFVTQGPGVLNAVIIQVMDLLYQKLARRLNEYENYRTIAEFEEHLVLKRMPFHFVNSNASLWFLAFYVQDLDRVRDRLWILMVLMQVLDNVKEVGVPFAQSVAARLFTPDGKRRPSFHLNPNFSGFTNELRSLPDRLQRILTQKRQAHYVDTFSDYKEMMVQYGYVALYTPIFPLAPLFALLNNVVESRSDFFKLVNSNGFQRPLVQHAHGIGVWERVLVSFSVVAVVVNCAFVWVYEMPQLLPAWSDLHRFMVLVACEHLVFVVKALLNWASPDTPSWIQNEKRIASLTSTHAQLLSPKRKLLHGQHW